VSKNAFHEFRLDEHVKDDHARISVARHRVSLASYASDHAPATCTRARRMQRGHGGTTRTRRLSQQAQGVRPRQCRRRAGTISADRISIGTLVSLMRRRLADRRTCRLRLRRF
jgi:hypothetical protein